MIIKRIGLFVLIGLVFFGCLSTGSGSVGNEPPLTLTIGDSRKLTLSGTPAGPVTWTSSDPEVVSVTDDGTVTALGFTSRGSDSFVSGPATGMATITATAEGRFSEAFTVITTTAGRVDMMNLPPLKDQFNQYFMMGNIFNPNDALSASGVNNERLIHHYNILTAENHMKPDQITRSQNSYDFSTADRMVNAAIASGFKVHGHTFLWHSQIPAWQAEIGGRRGTQGNFTWNASDVMDRAAALTAMRRYITDVAGHFRGRVYSWDVINEVFPDSVTVSSDWRTSMRTIGDSQAPNPWYVAIGADFVYYAFLAARQADPNAILYYNDYNTDQVGKATMIRNMVRDVNARYKQEFPNETRLLIEGIGIQEHHNISTWIANVRRSLDMFRPLGVIISVSELDILGQGWTDFSRIGSGSNRDSRSTVTNRGITEQARLYSEYMKLYIENADIIERVSLWGVTDDRSWRSAGLPLLFDHNDRAKPAYYGLISALN